MTKAQLPLVDNEYNDSSDFFTFAQGIVEKAFKENKISVYDRGQKVKIDKVWVSSDGRIELCRE
jgi:hypothetical protein